MRAVALLVALLALRSSPAQAREEAAEKVEQMRRLATALEMTPRADARPPPRLAATGIQDLLAADNARATSLAVQLLVSPPDPAAARTLFARLVALQADGTDPASVRADRRTELPTILMRCSEHLRDITTPDQLRAALVLPTTTVR